MGATRCSSHGTARDDSAINVNLLYERCHALLSEDELREAIVLVFANKQDLPNAMSVAEVTDKLGLHSLRNRKWYIQATCATSGEGLFEGLDWLSANIAG